MTRLLPAFLFCCASTIAQPLTMNDQAFMAQGSIPPALPNSGNLLFRWVYNLGVNTNANGYVTNWQDQVVHRNWTNYAASTPLAPTWTPNGVYFAGTNNFLQASNGPSTIDWSNGIVLVAIQGPINRAPAGTFGLLFGAAFGIGFELNYANTTWREVNGGGSGTTISSAITFGTNDIIFNADNKFYTNGVLSATGGNPGTFTTQFMGAYSGSSQYYSGYIFEILGYTGVTFTASDIAAVHRYSTNTYGGIP